MNVETEIGITKKDTQALKKCDFLGFRLENGETTAEAGKRPDRNEPFGRTQYHFFPCETSIEDYSKSGRGKTAWQGWAANDNYALEYVANPVRLLSNILRAGDVLRVRWIISDVSGFLQGKGLIHDACEVCIYRKGKNIGGFVWEEKVSEPFDIIKMIK